MLSDLDSADDTAASAPNDAEGEEQEEEEDSPSQRDAPEEEEEVDVLMQIIKYLVISFSLKNKIKHEEKSAGNRSDH